MLARQVTRMKVNERIDSFQTTAREVERGESLNREGREKKLSDE